MKKTTIISTLAIFTAILGGCTAPAAIGITAVNLQTGETDIFDGPMEVPAGWQVCDADGCPQTGECIDLDEAGCLDRADCSPRYEHPGDLDTPPSFAFCENEPVVLTECALLEEDACLERRDCEAMYDHPPEDDTPQSFAFCRDAQLECQVEECGPVPNAPSMVCDDGSIGGNIGVCSRNDDGVCGWELRECPQTCHPEDCGPLTAAGDDAPLCGGDGAEANLACAPLDGVCSWQYSCE